MKHIFKSTEDKCKGKLTLKLLHHVYKNNTLRKKLCLKFCFLIIVLIVICVFINYERKRFLEYTGFKVYNEKNLQYKYILLWTSAQAEPFVWIGTGQQGFIDRNCSYTNCIVTSDRSFFRDYTEFDVIAFAGPQLVQGNFQPRHLPQSRSLKQKYVFASMESAEYYPMNAEYYDDFFNWTWTFKIDSDLLWGYIHIKDNQGNTIGPKKVMQWMKHEDMLPTSNEVKEVLKEKSEMAAWFVSNCESLGKREEYVAELNKVLQTKYNLSIDIYGKCGKLKCEKDCDEMIKRDYFFYLAFENSFSEDYVTEKLSRALECNAIPIVYGGADYTRFLSNGSYLNSRELGVEKLASMMNELINDFEQYTEYFRWTNHYRYYRRNDAMLKENDYCNMCALLNDESRVKNVSMYNNFRKWWNNPE